MSDDIAVAVSDLRLGDILGDWMIDRIEEKPKSRVLHVTHVTHGWEHVYRPRRTSSLYVAPRKAYEVRAMEEHYGRTILDSRIERDLEEARDSARAFLTEERVQWAEVVEVELPGMHNAPGFDYADDGHHERIDR
jgi:hypothetical protein